MGFRYEMRLSGEGGQGLVLAGRILAEAAAIYHDLNATQSQSYGPEARGGASRSEVIISDEDIDYPKAEKLDLLLALTQEALNKYVHDLPAKAWLVLDSAAITQVPKGDWRIVSLPFVDLAREKLGKAIVANIVALGVIVRLSKVVGDEAAEQAIMARVPRGTEELNRRAFRLGLELAEEAARAVAGSAG